MHTTTYWVGEWSVRVTPGYSHSNAWRSMWKQVAKQDQAKVQVAA